MSTYNSTSDPRRLVQAAQNSPSGSRERVPYLLLGSLARERTLEAAQCLEREVEALDNALEENIQNLTRTRDEKINALNSTFWKDVAVLRQKSSQKRDLLVQEASQKRADCAPIRSLPAETLSRILTLATPDDFEFQISKSKQHPLSTVCRAWRDTIRATPNIWSRIQVSITPQSLRNKVENAERDLKSWLALAKSTPLHVQFYVQGTHPYANHSGGPLQAIWTLLLSSVENWQILQYSGSAIRLRSFWECSRKARKLDTLSCTISTRGPECEAETALELQSHCPNFPRLRQLTFVRVVPHDSVMDRMASLPSLQDLTLEDMLLRNGQLSSLSSRFPDVRTLHLDRITMASMPAGYTCPTFSFQSLHTCRVSRPHSYAAGNAISISALRGCRMLTTLQLDSEFILHFDPTELSGQSLPFVRQLELTGSFFDDTGPKLQILFSCLPLLKSLKVLPASTHPYCLLRGLLGLLLLQTDSENLPSCPDLSTLFLQGPSVSTRNLIKFMEQRTFNATSKDLNALEAFVSRCRTSWWYRNPKRDAIYSNWKPTCVITTTGSGTFPDMTNAGFGDVVDSLRTGKLKVDDSAWAIRAPRCSPDCFCECRDRDCYCCDHDGHDSENDYY